MLVTTEGMAAFTEERESPCRSLKTVDMVVHLSHPAKPPTASAGARRKRSRAAQVSGFSIKRCALHPTDERERAGVCALAGTQLKRHRPDHPVLGHCIKAKSMHALGKFVRGHFAITWFCFSWLEVLVERIHQSNRCRTAYGSNLVRWWVGGDRSYATCRLVRLLAARSDLIHRRLIDRIPTGLRDADIRWHRM